MVAFHHVRDRSSLTLAPSIKEDTRTGLLTVAGKVRVYGNGVSFMLLKFCP